MLLHFLGLVAENADDRKLPDGNDLLHEVQVGRGKEEGGSFPPPPSPWSALHGEQWKLIRPFVGSVEPGNKMDATNLATLFAPNLLHTFAEDPSSAAAAVAAAAAVGPGSPIPATVHKTSSGFSPAAIIKQTHHSVLPPGSGGGIGGHVGSPGASGESSSRMEHVSAVRLLIDRRESLFELPASELHDVYLSMYETCPEMLDALLRRRCALAGQE